MIAALSRLGKKCHVGASRFSISDRSRLVASSDFTIRRLHCSALALRRQDGSSSVILGWPFIGTTLTMQWLTLSLRSLHQNSGGTSTRFKQAIDSIYVEDTLVFIHSIKLILIDSSSGGRFETNTKKQVLVYVMPRSENSIFTNKDTDHPFPNIHLGKPFTHISLLTSYYYNYDRASKLSRKYDFQLDLMLLWSK